MHHRRGERGPGPVRRVAVGLALLAALTGLTGCQGRGAAAGDEATAASAGSSATPSVPEATTAPEATVASPSLEPLPGATSTTAAPGAAPTAEPVATTAPPLVTALPRDRVDGVTVRDVDSDIESFTYPASFGEGELANARIWVQQQRLVAECMVGKGFDYTYVLWWERPTGPRAVDDPDASALYPAGTPGFTAEYGEETDAPYDWTTAGCHGYAVHATGQDDAN